MNRHIADHGAIDFVAEGAAGADQPATRDDKYFIFAVAERLDDFVGRVIPELQRRGLFRHDYEGVTLREHLQLPRPKNRFFEN
jgi:hypothetical protein